jgi:hypothetical protein
MRWVGMSIVSLIALVGCNETEETVCDGLCRELVQSCSYAAYPSIESCRQGCEYASELGADITAEKECIIEAECDTFAIVECEHVYGAQE